MLLRTITESTPLDRFRQIERTLVSLGGNVDNYKPLDTDQLSRAIRVEESRADGIMRSMPVGGCLRDKEYGKARLTANALRALREYKNLRDGSIDLVEGLTYYRGAESFDNPATGLTYVRGQRTTYLGEGRAPLWVDFCESARKLKVLEMMRHGTDHDFSTMYLTMADGRPIDAQNGFIVEHLTESSDQALDLMEAYADSRWSGPWPWDVYAPKKLRDMIKGEQDMRNSRITEMRNRFREVYIELMEGELEQSRVIEAGKEFIEEVQGMIEDLGKAAGEILVNLRDQTRTQFGEESARQLEQAASSQIGIAVDALSALRTAIQHEMENLEHSIGQNPEGDMGGGLGGEAGMDPAAAAMAGSGGEQGMGEPGMGGGMGGEPGGGMGGEMSPGAAELAGAEGERGKR